MTGTVPPGPPVPPVPPAPPVPPVTDALRAEAAARPGGWVYGIDRYFDPAGEVPPYGIVGAWKVDERGELTGEFQHNSRYRPSPLSRGLPEPRDPVEAATQLAATGYGSDGAVRDALLEAVVYLLPGDGRPGIVSYTDELGTFVPVFTSAEHAPASSPTLVRRAFRELLEQLPADVAVRLNPGRSVSVRLPVADLLDGSR
ncbi:type VII secretion system-associated protein [Streptomyces sp. NPDC054904]|uniref:type VII secretion system-associated protein n=1 Tax=unclassified Streptomyces TaxID=2593676 RepID=UPI0029A10EBD|nr:type VII secretion system-associated protein [Streptomyces sp. DK15]MDX2395357.1 type VII secretion system-associated protein [Streptomyces sp. DK15]